MTETDVRYLVVPRDQLADALRGVLQQKAVSLQGRVLPRVSNKEAVVCWTPNSRRPCIIAIDDSDRDELFNWATSYHRDLSPLTRWCHVVSTREAERLSRNTRLEAGLFGTEAAWAGAAIAEAMTLSQRSYDAISLPACLATGTFAIGRTAALYGVRNVFGEPSERLDRVRERLNKNTERGRTAPHISTAVLLRLLPDAPPVTTWLQQALVKACQKLRDTSESDETTSRVILGEFATHLPKLSALEGLDEISAEQRVVLLRDIRTWIIDCKQEEERQLLFFVAGYIISRIGGAERDLRLAEAFEGAYFSVLTWAATIGGLGAATYWSDAFGGIGRLVARELSRSLDLVDPPTADISADEFFVISGAAKFRTALRQVATISLRPGVVVQLSTFDEDRRSRSDETLKTAPPPIGVVRERQESRQLEALANQIFPYIRNLLVQSGFEPNADKRSSRRTKPPQLPLK